MKNENTNGIAPNNVDITQYHIDDIAVKNIDSNIYDLHNTSNVKSPSLNTKELEKGIKQADKSINDLGVLAPKAAGNNFATFL